MTARHIGLIGLLSKCDKFSNFNRTVALPTPYWREVVSHLDCLQPASSLKIRLVLISAGAIATHDVMLR